MGCKLPSRARLYRKKVSFENRLVTIEVDLKVGLSNATVFTNDLSHDYVHENSAYAT